MKPQQSSPDKEGCGAMLAGCALVLLMWMIPMVSVAVVVLGIIWITVNFIL